MVDRVGAKQNRAGWDHALWMRVRRDRRLDEIEDLYRHRRQVFFRVARSITGDRELAAEAVQDGFADAVRSRMTYRGEGSLEAWVWRAVVNASRKAVRPLSVALSAVPEAASDASAPRPDLAPLISGLPERQRTALFLRYQADLPYAAIAQVLGVEVGTVSATLSAAHRAVRQSLQEAATHE
jgi:RNA polymerase sigma-70 factor, ECF subfamily